MTTPERPSFRLQGRNYEVGSLTPRAIGELRRFILSQIPDPRDRARQAMEGLPDAVAIAIWHEACDAARDRMPDLDSEAALEHLATPEGQALFLWIAFRERNAGFNLDAARALSKDYALSGEEFGALMGLMVQADREGSPSHAEPVAAVPGLTAPA